jgi:hydroxyacylglutathione hydrolase
MKPDRLKETRMILRQYLDTEPVVAASYLFGCGGKAMGAVVDPTGEIDRYLRDSEALGLPIRYVVDTHVHADHLSGGRRLAEVAGAEYVLFSGADARYPVRGVGDGEILELGNVSARVLHTPGHTPEHISLLVTDRTRGSEPWFVLTGHTLMVGDMGRTELASSAEEGARALFRSAERLRQLADHVEVLPSAFSGSVCGRGLSGKPLSTIGFERRFNRAFSVTDEEEFVALMLSDIPPRPQRAAEIRAENLGLTAAVAV